MQNYGGYYQQYQQGQNPMYPTPGGQNNQSNTRNMFGAPQNYGIPQMPQAPQQQYGYQQQQQMPQQNFVFHFDLNNTPSNMNMNMGPYAPANPPQYGASPYGGPQIPPNDMQKKEDKNDQLFDAFDPFNPKPRSKPKPSPQPQQNANPQPPATPNPPQIQMIEDIAPKKQDLNAFRTAFASLAGPAQQPQQPPPPQQQQQFGMQPGQMYGGNIQAPPPPQIEGFNFVSGAQNSQPVQMDNFNFGSQQPPQNNSFANQAPPQQAQSSSPSQPQAANASSSKKPQEDIFASFNPISSPQQTAPNQQLPTNFSTNNQVPNQFTNSDAFSFNQPQTGSSGGIQPAIQPQTGSGGGFTPFGQQQTGSNGGIQSFDQPQTGSGGGFTPFSQQHHQHHHTPQQAGSTGGILSFNPPRPSTIDPLQSFNQPQTGSGGIGAPFNQPQAGSTGNLPISAIDDLFGSASTSNQQQQPNSQASPSSDNPFLFNTSSGSNPFIASQNSDTNDSPLAPSLNNNETNQPQQQQEAQNNGIFTPFGSTQNQQKLSSGATSFGDSFRQAISEPAPSPSSPAAAEPPKPTEPQTSDFRNIFNQGHNFFEQQEQQLKASEQQQQQQQQPVAPEGFTFGSQTAGEPGAPDFSNFTFNSSSQPDQGQNPQFGGSSFANFGGNDQQSAPKPDQPAQNQPQSTTFAPFGVTDLQPMPNSTFTFSGSGDSVSSQPTAVSADPVDTEKIPYFAEQEKKIEFENRIKNDSMSVFDPFNPNPQPLQQQQQQLPQPQNPQQNEKKKQEEPKISASVNASVDTIRNMFGGPEDETENKEEEKQNETEEQKVTSTENFQQNDQQKNDSTQNPFFSSFTNIINSENNENKKPEIQLNVGIGDEDNNEKGENGGFENNPFSIGGNSDFQGNFGSSPEANSFGFGGFGFNNSFGKGNVFQHMFEQGITEKPATFGDFFPHHNSEPITAPVEIKDEEKAPPKSETPFAANFDLMGFSPQKQNQEEEEKKQQEPEQEEKNPFIFGKQDNIDFNNPFGIQDNDQQQQQNQNKKQEESNEDASQNKKNVDFDNPFMNQDNLSLFGQASSDSTSKQQKSQQNEPFNPFGGSNLETAPQTSSSMSFSSAEVFASQSELQKKEEPETTKKASDSKTNKKGGDIFDEIPNDISEIDTSSLPEKPPPFVMPIIGDNSSNPFTSVLASSSSNSASNNNNNKENPFVTNNSNPFVTGEDDEKAKKQEDEKEKEEPKKNEGGLDDLIGFDFGFSSSKAESNNTTSTSTADNEKKQSENPFIANFGNDETKQTEKVEDKKAAAESETKTEQDTSGFTFSSATTTATNDGNEGNPFSKGFNPFGGDFSNPFASQLATNNNDNNQTSGGFTFTPSFDKEDEEKKAKENNNNQEEKNQTNQIETETEKQQQNQTEEIKKDENNEKDEKKDEQDNNMNITDTLDDDLFDMNSIEEFKPVQHKGQNNDLFGEIHTFPVSNSTSDFLELKQKKEKENNNAGQSILMMSDGGVGNKSPISPLTEKSHQNINNTGFISILTPYGNAADELQFSLSSDGDDPEVLKIMSDDNPISKILKKYVKPPENDFYGPFEKDPHPIRIFPKFEDTEAAKVLADFVSKQFGITASFASTSRKQKEEIDMNSIFNVPAASEPNDDDDFLLII